MFFDVAPVVVQRRKKESTFTHKRILPAHYREGFLNASKYIRSLNIGISARQGEERHDACMPCLVSCLKI